MSQEELVRLTQEEMLEALNLSRANAASFKNLSSSDQEILYTELQVTRKALEAGVPIYGSINDYATFVDGN